MRPLLEKLPQKKRNLYFGPVALGLALVGFVIMGFVMTAANPEAPVFLVSLLLGPFVGVAGAWALYGWPHLTTRSGKPLVSERWKPFLFFPLFPALAAVAYVVAGVFLTPVLPPTLLAYVALGIGVVVGGVAAYLLVGFPRLVRFAKEQWARVPEERRPWLFFLAAPLFAVAFIFALGLALTPSPVPIGLQPLLVFPGATLLGCVAAYFLVGFPKPAKPLASYVPDVPGRRRPLAFFLTFVLAGLPLAYLAGLLLSLAPGFPDAALLPLALLLGYAAALGVAALAWGTPRSWRRFADYKPGIPEGARVALFFPVVLVGGIVGSVGAFLLNVDLFWGILAGTALGVLGGLKVSGALGKYRELRQGSRTLLPEMPDMVKPLVLLPTWLLVSGLLFVVLGYVLHEYFVPLVTFSLAVGLAVAVYLVEEATFKDWLAEHRAERARDAERKRRRAEALKSAGASGKKA